MNFIKIYQTLFCQQKSELLKEGARQELPTRQCNYRPITIPPTLSSVLKILIYFEGLSTA